MLRNMVTDTEEEGRGGLSLRVFGKSVLSVIFPPKSDEVTEEWIKLNN